MHHMFSAELKCRLCIYVYTRLCFQLHENIMFHYVQDYVFSYMKTGDDSIMFCYNTWLYDGR